MSRVPLHRSSLWREVKTHWPDLLVYGFLSYLLYLCFIDSTKDAFLSGLGLMYFAIIAIPAMFIWMSARLMVTIPNIANRRRREELAVTPIPPQDPLKKNFIGPFRYHLTPILVFATITAIGLTETIRTQERIWTGPGLLDGKPESRELFFRWDPSQFNIGLCWFLITLGIAALQIAFHLRMTRRACASPLDTFSLYSIYLILTVLLSGIPTIIFFFLLDSHFDEIPFAHSRVLSFLAAASFLSISIALTFRAWRNLVRAYFIFD